MENNNPSIIEGNKNNNENNNNDDEFQINIQNGASTSYQSDSQHDYSINEYTLSDSDGDDKESLLGILDELASIDNFSRLFISNSNILPKSNSIVNINGIGGGGSSENLLKHSLSKNDLLELQEQEELIKKQTTSPFKDHKNKKDILLCYLTLTLLLMSVMVYSLFLPNVFTNYVIKNYPNLTTSAEIQNKASYFKSFSDSIPFIFMFLFGPFLGVLSDKYGRKLLLYYGVSVIVLDMIACFITIKTNSLIYFYVAHSIAGTSTVAYAAVYSFIADISDDVHVPFLYSLAGVSMGFGVVLGPVVSILTNLHETSTTGIQMTTLYVAGGLVASNLLVITFLKESLTIAKENNKIKITKSTSNPFKLVKRIFTANGYIAMVILLYGSINYTGEDIMSTYFYHNSLVYGWGETQNSLYMGGLGLLIMIWSAFIVPFFLKRFSERKLVSVGFLVGFFTHIAYSFAYTKWIWIGTTVLEAFVPSIMNLLTSVISRATPPEIKGSIITGARSVGAIAGFLGSLVSGNVYRYFTGDNTPIFFPGAPYLLNTVIYLSTFLFSLFIWRKYSNPNPLIRKGDKKKNQSIIKRSKSSINVQVSVN